MYVCLPGTACEPLNTPASADANCSDENNLGSVCEFNCFAGFTRVGVSESICIETTNGLLNWSSSPPSCRSKHDILQKFSRFWSDACIKKYCPYRFYFQKVLQYRHNRGTGIQSINQIIYLRCQKQQDENLL